MVDDCYALLIIDSNVKQEEPTNLELMEPMYIDLTADDDGSVDIDSEIRDVMSRQSDQNSRAPTRAQLQNNNEQARVGKRRLPTMRLESKSASSESESASASESESESESETASNELLGNQQLNDKGTQPHLNPLMNSRRSKIVSFRTSRQNACGPLYQV